MRILKLLAAALLLSSSSVAIPKPRYDIPREAIVYVSCGLWMGTAVKVGPDEYLTAAHVVTDDKGKVVQCVVNGEPVSHVRLNGSNDSALFTGPVSDVSAKYSCKGTDKFGHYVAIGYAKARPFLTYEPLISTDIAVNGMTAFIGNMYHGMSGGPIVGQDGKVYAIVNMGEPNRGVEVKDTDLCKTSMRR